jgi:hypothetical protein
MAGNGLQKPQDERWADSGDEDRHGRIKRSRGRLVLCT